MNDWRRGQRALPLLAILLAIAGTVQTADIKDQLLSGFSPIMPDDFAVGGQEIPLSLHDAVTSVLRRNQGIQVASHRPDQARAGIMEAKAAYDPEAFAEWEHSRNENPGVTSSGERYKNRYTYDGERVGVRQRIPTGGSISGYREWEHGSDKRHGYDATRDSGGAYVLELSQPLLNGFGDREVRTIIEVSRLQYDMSEEEFRQIVIQTTADAIEAYWSVALAREEVRIAEETLAMAQTLLERESLRQGQELSTQLDVHRAREAVSTRTSTLLTARDQEQMAQERLKLMMNSTTAPIGADARILVTEGMETPLVRADMDKSINTALENRPELRNASLAIRAGEARESYARHNLLPELNVGGSLRRNDRHSSDNVPGSRNDTIGSDWTFGASFSIPLGNMAARAQLRLASSELSQSIDEKKNAESIIITEVKTAVKSLDLLVQEIPQSRRAAEAAIKVVEGERARFELNQVGNRDLLQAQDLLAVSERNRIQTMIRYNVAIARLLEAEGTLLEKMGVKLMR
jgi:outer membrane protein TolC